MIIACSGKIASGKDTVAKYIQKTYPEYRFVKKSFGYNVKKVCAIMSDVSLQQQLSRKGKLIFLPDWNMTVGQMQQKVATELFRDKLNYDSWVISLFSTYTEEQNWVISDLRFKNEAEAIKKHDGIIIRLNGDPAGLREKDTRDPTHISETDLDDYDKFDIIWENKPNIDTLKKLMEKLTPFLFKKQLISL